jgi:hypothetical protein
VIESQSDALPDRTSLYREFGCPVGSAGAIEVIDLKGHRVRPIIEHPQAGIRPANDRFIVAIKTVHSVRAPTEKIVAVRCHLKATGQSSGKKCEQVISFRRKKHHRSRTAAGDGTVGTPATGQGAVEGRIDRFPEIVILPVFFESMWQSSSSCLQVQFSRLAEMDVERYFGWSLVGIG